MASIEVNFDGTHLEDLSNILNRGNGTYSAPCTINSYLSHVDITVDEHIDSFTINATNAMIVGSLTTMRKRMVKSLAERNYQSLVINLFVK